MKKYNCIFPLLYISLFLCAVCTASFVNNFTDGDTQELSKFKKQVSRFTNVNNLMKRKQTIFNLLYKTKKTKYFKQIACINKHLKKLNDMWEIQAYVDMDNCICHINSILQFGSVCGCYNYFRTLYFLQNEAKKYKFEDILQENITVYYNLICECEQKENISPDHGISTLIERWNRHAQ